MPKYDKKSKQITMSRFDLGEEVREILELPAGRWIRCSQGMKIVNHILNVITTALQNGESVHIHGFGTFSIKTRNPIKRNHIYFHNRKVMHVEPTISKAKKYVHFKPTVALRKFIAIPLMNEEELKKLPKSLRDEYVGNDS